MNTPTPSGTPGGDGTSRAAFVPPSRPASSAASSGTPRPERPALERPGPVGDGSLPSIATQGVEVRVALWWLGVPLLLAAALGVWVWVPSTLLGAGLGVVLLGAAGWVCVLAVRGSGGTRAGGLRGRPGRLGRLGGRPGGGAGRGLDGRFTGLARRALGGLGRRFPRASRAAGRWAGGTRGVLGRARGRLPRALGGTGRSRAGTPGGTSRGTRPAGRWTGMARRLGMRRPGFPSRPRGGVPVGRGPSRPTRPGSSSAAGTGRGPGRPAGAGGRPSGGRPGGGAPRGGRPGGPRGTTISTDDDFSGFRDRDTTGRDTEDDDRAGLPWWQRVGYGLADRLQTSGPAWLGALVAPLRAPDPDLSEFDTDDDVPATPLPEELWPDPGPWPSLDHDDPVYPAIDEDDPIYPATDPDEPTDPADRPAAAPAGRPVEPRTTRKGTTMTAPIRDNVPHARDYLHYLDESTPGTRSQKLHDAAAAVVRDANREAERAEDLRAEARKIENITALADDYDALVREARRQERNANVRLEIAREFRAAADRQLAS